VSAVILSQVDNGKLVEIKQGQTLAIHLPENPTTGYRWEIDSVNVGLGEGNEIIILESSSFAPAPSVGIGGDGERTIIFKAANVGTTQLNMKRWQSWEGNHSIIERYSLTCRVRG